MQEAARGIVTSASGARWTAEPPRVRRAPVVGAPKDAESGRVFTYVTSRARYLIVKVVARGDNPQHVALANAILGYPEHYRGYIEFDNFKFKTTRPLVAQYLDGEIRSGRVIGVARDQEMVMMRCSLCDELFPNNAAGHKNLGEHMMEFHPPVDMPAVPVYVGDYTYPGAPSVTATVGILREHEERATETVDGDDVDLTDFDLGALMETDDPDPEVMLAEAMAEPATEQAAPFTFAAEPVEMLAEDESVEAEADEHTPAERRNNPKPDGRRRRG